MGVKSSMALKFSKLKKPANNKTLFGILMSSVCQMGLAQDGPADLLDLSLEDLFSAEIGEIEPTNKLPRGAQRWRFQAKYQQSEFDGINIGSERMSPADVLFQPGLEPRSNENYPVVPSRIHQTAESFALGYQVNKLMALQLVVPFIHQSTDHFSIVSGYERFIIESDGIGDVVLLGSYNLQNIISDKWQLSFGVSLPVGSIDEEGDTPRSPGNQQLPFSMQIGSGTYDLPIGLTYSNSGNAYSWGANLTGKIRLGENDRNYTLGNRIAASSWLQLNTMTWIKPSLKVSYSYIQEIDGIDPELLTPTPFPFPAPVTDPSLYGGRQVDITLGFRIPVSSRQQIDIEIGNPLYQSLNGPQVREKYRLSASMNFRL
jgi:hypothetical protein